MDYLDEEALRASKVELLRFAVGMCGRCSLPTAEAEDLVHDAIVELFDRLDEERPPECSQLAFLMQTIKSRAFDRIRRQRRRGELLAENRDRVPQPVADAGPVGWEDSQLADMVLKELQAEAEEDEEAWSFLQALIDNPGGSREERCEAAGLSIAGYEAAKKRLGTMLRRIPSELKDNTQDMLNSVDQGRSR